MKQRLEQGPVECSRSSPGSSTGCRGSQDVLENCLRKTKLSYLGGTMEIHLSFQEVEETEVMEVQEVWQEVTKVEISATELKVVISSSREGGMEPRRPRKQH